VDRTNGDARADIAFHVLFAPPHAGQQTATVYYAAGSAAELTHAVGAIIIERAPVSFGAEAQVQAAQHHDRNAGTHSRRLCCRLRKHRRHRRTKLQRAAARLRRGEAGW